MQTEDFDYLISELLFSESQLIFKTLEEHFECEEYEQVDELVQDTDHSTLKFV